MKCKKCGGEWNPPVGSSLSKCPFCGMPIVEVSDIDEGKLPHEVLRWIVEKYGTDILMQQTQLSGMIGDLLVVEKRVGKILKCAIRDRVGIRLLELGKENEEERVLGLNRIKFAFVEDNYFQSGIGNYVVDCFAYALGWTDELDGYIEEDEKQDGKEVGGMNFFPYDGGGYCGEYNEEGERAGFGVFMRENGMRYCGGWKMDFRQGLGLYEDGQDNHYAGEWKLNKCAGLGIKIWEDGVKYAGEWRNGKIEGWGMLLSPNGERYVGEFMDGVFNGFGIYYWGNGSHYQGGWRDGDPEGEGTHYYRDGRVEQQSWKDGKRIR